jgi:nucleoside-diphosphate-sugar epimerase
LAYLRAMFIGGNGIISSACSRLAVEKGIDVTLLNRGMDKTRLPIDGAKALIADAADPESVRSAIGSSEFDVVVNFRVFDARHAKSDIDIFSGRTGQYVFISTAAGYQKPVKRLPITESTPLGNPFSAYAQNKIARAFVELLGNPQTIGDSFHITSDEALTWDMIAECLANAAGATADIVHVASTRIVRELPEWEGPILGDKSYSLVFDNSKIKNMAAGWTARIPFWRGAQQIIDWYDAHPGQKIVDPRIDRALDRLAGVAE